MLWKIINVEFLCFGVIMSFKDKLTNIVKSVFDSPDQNEYNFTLSSPYENDGNNVSMTPEELDKNEEIFEAENIFPSLSVNLELLENSL